MVLILLLQGPHVFYGGLPERTDLFRPTGLPFDQQIDDTPLAHVTLHPRCSRVTARAVDAQACSLVVLVQAMFWCVGTFQDSRPIPRSLVRRTGAPSQRIRLPARRPGWGRAGLPVSEPAGASGYWSAGEPT